MARQRTLSLFIMVPLFTLGLAGCGTEQVDSSPARTAAAPAGDGIRAIDPEAAAYAFPGVEYDYEPQTPSELARISTLIVRGKIVGYQLGRTIGSDNRDDVEATNELAMQVSVEAVAKGDATVGEDVYVEIPKVPTEPFLPKLEETLPHDTSVVLFLEPAVQEEPNVPIGNENAGRPPGAPLYQPLVQGFVVGTGPVGTVRPFLHTIRSNQVLADIMP